jgi:arylformamidase
MKIYDISLPVSEKLPVWPGDPSISMVRTKSILSGDPCNLTMISMGVHSGTHIDAPYHFVENGRTVDAIVLETCIGPCQVIEVSGSLIEKEDLLKHNFRGQNRILFKTRNSERWNSNENLFHPDYVALSPEAAEYLVENKVMLIGIDYLSIEAFNATGNHVHDILLKNDVVILEGLNLSEVAEGMYELIALPLKLVGSEGAPARAILRETLTEKELVK